jgi:uncharacterized protein YbbC (DUF1343 family)
MMRTILGIERLAGEERRRVRGRRVGLLAHPASVDARFSHALDLVIAAGADVRILFGPEHGFGGEAQDMEPVGGLLRGPHGLPLVSLYGATEETLAPRPEHLAGLDALVVDLADVGSRYYTFVWTAVLCLRACHRAGVQVIALDRPNPLGGAAVEGAPQAPGFLSFVGLLPIANRHGLTIAEVLRNAARLDGTEAALTIVEMRGWRREMLAADTGLPWVMPSPNMPTPDTALVYPGGCLVEATWASEGRGTTRPFELVGAPEIDSGEMLCSLEAARLPGVRFRQVAFRPTFQKHAGRTCKGVQLHVTDARAFLPYRTGVALLCALRSAAGGAFEWRVAPYEFVREIPAIDLLAGNDAVRRGVESGASVDEIAATWAEGERAFGEERRGNLLY